jgi:CDGSH iron-sulfur domain-containing protein 3
MRFVNDTSDTHPLVTTLQPGTYAWCRCGRTHDVPFCDGSHEGTGIEPLEFEIAEAESVSLCNCGLTQNPPYCDGSHALLEKDRGALT